MMHRFIRLQATAPGVHQIDLCDRCDLQRHWLTPVEDTGNGVRYVFPDGMSVGGPGVTTQLPPCEPEPEMLPAAA